MDTSNFTTKRCTVCGCDYPQTREYFYKDDRKLDGLFSSCKSCCKAKRKVAYYQDPEKARAASKKYYTNNKEKAYACSLAWAKANPDKIAKHRLSVAAKKRETEKRRVQRNPDQKRANNQARKARKRALRADFTAEQWQRAVHYFNGCCAVCGRPPGLWHKLAMDHWIPMNRGGEYTASNIIPLCNGIGGCNQNKKAKEPEIWLQQRYGKRNAKQILKRIEEYFTWLDILELT